MRTLSLIIFLFLSVPTWAQQAQLKLALDVLDKDTGFVQEVYRLPRQVPAMAVAKAELTRLVRALRERAYLTASVDSVAEADGVISATLYVGKSMEWVELAPGNVTESMLSAVGFRSRQFRERPYAHTKIIELQDNLLSYLEDHGFPFASLELDSIQLTDSSVSAQFYLDKNQLVTIDSLVLHGDARISDQYMQNYLGITPGMLYNESVIQRIPTRIRELPFLEEEQPARVLFIKEHAMVHLFLKAKRASRFNFIIGFLPNSTQVVPQVKSKLLITGEANLHLHNPLGAGEEIDVEWKRLKANTQSLNADVTYPYIGFLPIPVGVDLDLRIYRQDTLFVERELGFGFQYLFTGKNYLKAFVSNKRSTVLSVNEALIISTRKLPSYVDVSHDLYGLEYYFERLDYRLNPRRGVTIMINGGLGEKKILRNDKITSLEDPNDPSADFGRIYDSLDLRTVQYKVSYEVQKFWKVGKISAIKTGVAGAVFVSEDIFINELYRIGGAKVLRGFDEQAILASQYHIATLEYRVLLDQNSYFYLFGDGAYLENPLRDGKLADTPFGIGAGMTFQTGAGLFNLSYAVGRQLGNTIDFRAAKIHFGYMNYF